MNKKQFLPSLLLAGSVTASQAAVTYVDATTSNTTLDGTPLVLDTNYMTSTGGGYPTDGLWNFRTGLNDTNNSNVFNSQGGTDTENSETTELDLLVTTFTLPEAGQYNIYGYFWIGSEGAADWDAGFELGNTTGASAGSILYTNANATDITTITGASTHFTDSSVKYGANSTPNMFEASLGVWDTAVDGFEVTVIVDGSQISTPNADNRTWYDGLGYQVIPEPATYALLGGLMALTSVALRRRVNEGS